MGEEVRASTKEVSGGQNGTNEANNLQLFTSTICKSFEPGTVIYMMLPMSRKLHGT